MLSESQLNAAQAESIQAELEQIVCRGRFAGINEIALDWACYHPEGATEVVLVVNGRIESHYKYWETIAELVTAGYAVFTYDHRGQGASQRMTQNPHKGYVEAFHYYSDDLHQLCQHELWPRQYQQTHLLCHSMGCCVAAHYLIAHAPHICSVAFCSPMFQIHSGKIPEFLAKQLVNSWAFCSRLCCHLFGGEPGYFLFGSNYKDKPFNNNLLSHSSARYQLFRALYQSRPELQLGSPTPQWVEEAVQACAAVLQHAHKIRLPILILEAGDDEIVDRRGIVAFTAAAQECRHHCIDGAKHELLIEADQFRQPTMQAILSFFAQNSAKAGLQH
ncbi:alpha/beta fold hydrolase [Corallincola luteus]|uniref:Alpha/beta fold hydrolase n=1 Tax=Corallincola luteus TaxID=1775177 RepID=A0ABY2AMZ6_9GAMM|nr:alpha/beta fold hydrolase [Corallincola luteus]TCI04010.1 alpha/beta fold hydrolase [Corallincola luteus]